MKSTRSIVTFQISAVVHDGSVVIANLEVIATLSPLVAPDEVMLPIFWDVAPFDGHIPVPVSSGVLVKESCKFSEDILTQIGRRICFM